MNSSTIVCFLLGALLALLGYPIFPKEGFNPKNLMITVSCCLIAVLVMRYKNRN